MSELDASGEASVQRPGAARMSADGVPMLQNLWYTEEANGRSLVQEAFLAGTRNRGVIARPDAVPGRAVRRLSDPLGGLKRDDGPAGRAQAPCVRRLSDPLGGLKPAARRTPAWTRVVRRLSDPLGGLKP